MSTFISVTSSGGREEIPGPLLFVHNLRRASGLDLPREKGISGGAFKAPRGGAADDILEGQERRSKKKKVVYMSPGELVPYPGNAKQHPPEQVERIANSIKRFGWQQPIVVDRENVVIIGHGRLFAAKELMLDSVPVVYADNFQLTHGQNEFAEIHKAVFPVELPTTIINIASKCGSVLDLFGGTGTTLISCEQTGRKCFMMELDPLYVDVIIKRWEEFTGQKSELIQGVD